MGGGTGSVVVVRRRRGGVCVSPQEARGSVRIRSSSRGDSRAFVGRKFFSGGFYIG